MKKLLIIILTVSCTSLQSAVFDMGVEPACEHSRWLASLSTLMESIRQDNDNKRIGAQIEKARRANTLEYKDSLGRTALFHAVLTSTFATHLLLLAGAKTDVVDHEGISLMQYAYRHSSIRAQVIKKYQK